MLKNFTLRPWELSQETIVNAQAERSLQKRHNDCPQTLDEVRGCFYTDEGLVQRKSWETEKRAFSNTFTKRRQDGLLFGFDDSTYKVGRQITKNWCGSILSEVKVPWTSENFSKDRLRTVLKSTFYPFDFFVFNHWFFFNCMFYLVLCDLSILFVTLINFMVVDCKSMSLC